MHQKLYSKLALELEKSEFIRSRSRIERFSRNAPNCYKVYTIPKRTSGYRVIAHPSKELKIYQRALTSILSDSLKAHHTSYAYKKGFSIKDNALKHAQNKYLLKMDFNDFFNTIEPDIFHQALNRLKLKFSNAEKRLLTQLLFWNKTKSSTLKLVLSVGAPSSPLISNFVMFEFDQIIDEYCNEKSIVYTRYADDITFSSSVKGNLFNVPHFVQEKKKKNYNYRISVNESKTVFSSKAHNRHVTGITLANDNTLSIGRTKKRMTSAMVHKYSINKLDSNDLNYLKGLLSFISHVEPQFFERLKKKYGNDVLNRISKGDLNE